MTPGFNVDYPLRRQTGGGERRRVEVWPFHDPQDGPGMPGEGARDEQRRCAAVFHLGGGSGHFM